MDQHFPAEADALGPAMRALSPFQQRFVIAALDYPAGKGWQIAKAAGYTNSRGGLRVTAHRNFHSEKVIAALHEEAGKRLRGSGVIGVAIMRKIALTDGHKDQLRAAEALMNRIGFHETSEHKVTVDHTDRTGRAIEDRIRELAGKLGLDPARFLGVNAMPPMKLIEGEDLHGDVCRAEPSLSAGMEASGAEEKP